MIVVKRRCKMTFEDFWTMHVGPKKGSGYVEESLKASLQSRNRSFMQPSLKGLEGSICVWKGFILKGILFFATKTSMTKSPKWFFKWL